MSKRGRDGMPLRPTSTAASTSGVMIEIRGIPPNVTPLLVETLRVCTKFFQHASSVMAASVGQEDYTNSIEPEQSTAAITGSVVDDIMTRMTSNTEEDKQKERLVRMQQAIKNLLQAIQHESREKNINNNMTTPSSSKVSSVSVSSLIYISNLFQTHGRVEVRRAALHVCGQLLLKCFAECQSYLMDHLMEWMDAIVDSAAFAFKNPDRAATQVPLLQAEMMQWLTVLEEGQEGATANKLRVAQRLLRQRCPGIATTGTTEDDSIVGTQNNAVHMVELRRLRDLALEHGKEECMRVARLVQRAQACLNVLVPRFGHERSGFEVSTILEAQGNNDSDSDEDVAWEDGDGDQLQQEYSHVAAVEQTLAAMEHTGGLLQSGTLEINFAQEDDHRDETPQDNEQDKMLAKDRLQNCVRRLALRHMPRLSSWTDALIRADGLYQPKESKSLVLLPVTLAQERRNILESLLETKSSVASVLSSASRLAIAVPNDSQQSAGDRNPQQRTTAGIATRRNIRIRPASQTTRRNGVRQPRSNRVQIKYRTS